MRCLSVALVMKSCSCYQGYTSAFTWDECRHIRREVPANGVSVPSTGESGAGVSGEKGDRIGGDAPAGTACFACTYINAADAATCAMCDGALQSGDVSEGGGRSSAGGAGLGGLGFEDDDGDWDEEEETSRGGDDGVSLLAPLSFNASMERSVQVSLPFSTMPHTLLLRLDNHYGRQFWLQALHPTRRDLKLSIEPIAVRCSSTDLKVSTTNNGPSV